MNEIELYYEDFNETGKAKILMAYGISTPEEANLDVFPVTTLSILE